MNTAQGSVFKPAKRPISERMLAANIQRGVASWAKLSRIEKLEKLANMKKARDAKMAKGMLLRAGVRHCECCGQSMNSGEAKRAFAQMVKRRNSCG